MSSLSATAFPGKATSGDVRMVVAAVVEEIGNQFAEPFKICSVDDMARPALGRDESRMFESGQVERQSRRGCLDLFADVPGGCTIRTTGNEISNDFESSFLR
jgi:hypothetical protein